MDITPSMIVIAARVLLVVMVIAIIAIGSWYKVRDNELKFQQEMRTREMEHHRKMKELELEVEKEKNRRAAEKAA